MTEPQPYYITTPIYYVNDAPHVGHCYTTLLADAAARAARFLGRDTFFLTGTDEHAEKVVESAAKRGVTPMDWADRNAATFRDAFSLLRFTNDDFIRTTEPRHTKKVVAYIQKLLDQGDIELGDYVGWWDVSQEEYVTETTAREHDFKSPVTGRPLEKRTEQNYFFRLDRYGDKLLAHIEARDEEERPFILPEARRNEVVGRIRQGLQKVPVSRAIDPADPASQWGIRMPGDEEHRVYVWIDALFNYLSVVDTPDRRKYWPATIHVMAKDILWFHAVIWPCMLMALGEPLPGRVYAHSYWIREGRKMSKSLGNFIDLPTLEAYIDDFGLDAVRWFLLTNGPLGATDADFAHAKFVEVYNADLANGFGNAFSRVSNMIVKYFDGAVPEPSPEYTPPEGFDDPTSHPRKNAELHAGVYHRYLDNFVVDGGARSGLFISQTVDAYIHATAPFKLAKDESKRGDVATILYECAEALRIASLLLYPAMPDKMAEVWRRMGQEIDPTKDTLADLTKWGGLKPGTRIEKGESLFPRADADAPPPTPTPTT